MLHLERPFFLSYIVYCAFHATVSTVSDHGGGLLPYLFRYGIISFIIPPSPSDMNALPTLIVFGLMDLLDLQALIFILTSRILY